MVKFHKIENIFNQWSVGIADYTNFKYSLIPISPTLRLLYPLPAVTLHISFKRQLNNISRLQMQKVHLHFIFSQSTFFFQIHASLWIYLLH